MSRKDQAKLLVNSIKKIAQKDSTRTLNELRVLIAMERVVARLESHSSLRDHILFKGGFVLLKSFNSPRFTRDIDALANGLTKVKLKKLIQEALDKDLADGFWYGDVQFEDLPLQDGYGGLRISFAFQIGDPPENPSKLKKLSRLHLDLSFEEPPSTSKLEKMNSVVENLTPISWNVYPIEYIVAEKLEAMFSRGSTNSRAKDVFDLNFLLPKISNKTTLVSAIEKTFEKRPTSIPSSFANAAEQFDLKMMSSAWMSVEIDTKTEQFIDHWSQFLKNLRLVLN
jgi:predicted nucleotidyltransferase component of viral defense system